jgi:hypothetical protein
MIEDLKAIGIEVIERDPDTGEQWGLNDSTGHLRGHMDGVAVNIHGIGKAVLEFKTHNEDSFKKLVTNGVRSSKPGHYKQLMLYMHFSKIPRAFYLAHNKNTDELYSEMVEYDPVVGMALESRGRRIIEANSPPPRLFEDPDSKLAYACKRCPSFDVCHQGKFANRTCRTCLHSTPVEDGKWRCEKYNTLLESEFQRKGCTSHRYIPMLVPGRMIGATEDATIVYELPNGGKFIDGQS